MKRFATVGARFAGVALSLGVLLGCAGGAGKHKPADLPPDTGRLKWEQVWSSSLSNVAMPLTLRLVGQELAVAASDGSVAVFDVRSGVARWRSALDEEIAAGVGYDGRLAAVITLNNEVVVLDGGKEIWRQRLSAQSLTAPLVAGQRVFVLGADRSVLAFDGMSGRRLWQQQRAGEPLVLRQSGVLTAVGDTLIVGLSGKLAGLDPLNGSIRWEVAIAAPRGTNVVERLVDLVGDASRSGDVVCARAFQAAVGCVHAGRGALLWTQPADGFVGLHGDAQSVYGVEADGTLLAWRRSSGENFWRMDKLRYRKLSQPWVAAEYVVVGDDEGRLHFLSREDGATLARVPTDGSALAAPPLQVDDMLVVVTRKGTLYGFKPL